MGMMQNCACAVVFLAATAPAMANDVDRLSPERMTAIQVAYDEVLRDPEHDNDRLSTYRLAAIHAAFDAWAAQDVDQLTASRWDAMQKAYKTHDPERLQFAAR